MTESTINSIEINIKSKIDEFQQLKLLNNEIKLSFSNLLKHFSTVY